MKKLVRIDALVFDWELYPRLKVGWFTAYQYAQAMKAGSEFPPILVGTLPGEGRLYVVDGWHRIEARKLLREEYVETTIRKFDSKREMFVEAVRRNNVHGRPLSVQEKVRLINKLKEMEFRREEISELVKVPIDKLERFSVRTIIGPNGKPVYLKSVVAKIDVTEKVLLDINMDSFNVRNIKHLLTQFVELLESGAYQKALDDEGTKELTVRAYALLGEVLELTSMVEAK